MARKQGSHSEITGPKVRESALRLIARHGFAAVSMRQIAADVGVQAGALYNYTADKQSLLFDLMQVHMEDLLAALNEAAISGTALQQLEAFTRFHIRYHIPRPDQVFVAYMELRSLTPENFAKIEQMRRSYEERLETILDLGEREGVFDLPDRRITALALIALLTGVNNWYRAGGRLPVSRIEAIYWDLVRKAVSVSESHQ